MSEILTFNLPITISRERFDAIVKEAARKVYTEGLVDPGESLMPEVAKAATAALQSPPGIIPGGEQLPIPVELARPAVEGGSDRPIPPGAWEQLHAYIRARSVPTAALLAQKASIVRWAPDGTVYLKMAKPFAEQFRRQPAKNDLLGQAVELVFGSGARWDIVSDPAAIQESVPPGKEPLGPELQNLIGLMNSGEWTYHGGHRKMKPVSALRDTHGRIICYMMPRCPGVIFLPHLSEPVRGILGESPNITLALWLRRGILLECRRYPKDKTPRYSHNVSVLGTDVTLSKLSISRLQELGVSLNTYQW